MKTNKKKALLQTLFALVIFAAPVVFAEQETDMREGPCNKIQDACKTYAKLSKTKISIYNDCMKPLLNNEKISEIKIDPDDLKACQAKKAEVKQKK